MKDAHLESLTLREKLIDTERLTRELSQHLEQGFIPKVQALRRVTRTAEGATEETTDATVRNTVTSILESETFATELSTRLNQYVVSIETEVGKIMKGH